MGVGTSTITMGKKDHLLADLWNKYPEVISSQPYFPADFHIGHYISEVVATGSFYSYVIQLADYSLHFVDPAARTLHPLQSLPTQLADITSLIHPDDLGFVLAAEKAGLEKIRSLGFEHSLQLKCAYCFRMQVHDGSYHLFHHQALHLSKDEEGRVSFSLNIHTDIQHITAVNNKIVLISGIEGRNDYWQIDLSEKHTAPMPLLSRREMEVLGLLAQGYSSKQIGQRLFISELTVRVHRKNLLKKTNSSKSGNLVKKCYELGLL